MSGNKLSDLLGTTEQGYKLDGTNYIDAFPAILSDPLGGTAPDSGNITIQGVRHAVVKYAVNETQGCKIELNHNYKDGGGVDIHCRFFPVNDNAGTVNFTYDYYIMHVDGTTTAGTLAALSTATIVAGDKTANKGQYVSAAIPSTLFVAGDLMCGKFKRIAGTYGSDVAIMEIGSHQAQGSIGQPIP